MTSARFGWVAALVLGAAVPAAAQTFGQTYQITRAAGAIHIDGDLSDEGWRNAMRIDKWYEATPGNNTEPAVKNVGYLTYDDRYLYVGLEFEDPDPSAIRAPLGDHDNLNGNSTDFGGIFIDAQNTGRTATEFFVSAHNVQYDAVTEDGSNENSSPDFFWDSATRITAHGWSAEMRIPFTTLRYKRGDPQTWGIILLRSYPRGFRYQFASTPIPRGANCTVCFENLLAGLSGLPAGGHLIAAPYVSSSETARPPNDTLGQALVREPLRSHIGVDVKYTPDANNALDLTVKPDFSQVESDTAQISANERFALFFPEKRPFFLEGVDLFQTPFQAVYTRTITSPTWGGRVTGKEAGLHYTALVAEDAGGGTVILPGPNESDSVEQDFSSRVFVGRAKWDVGKSFVGAVVTDREATGLSAHNRVAGPDFQWRASQADVISGQWLLSDTRTPNQPDVAAEWNGQRLTGSAFQTYWNHNTTHLDAYTQYKEVTSGFRADTGFIPQVGFREGFESLGWTIHPKNVISRERTFLNLDYQVEPSGRLITRQMVPGFGMDTLWNGFMQFRYVQNTTRAGDNVFGRKQFGYIAQFSPSRRVTFVGVDGIVGSDIDFANSRPASGSTINLSATLQPTDHFELAAIANTRTLDVDASTGSGPGRDARRLFTQRVERVKGTYTFTSRLFVRVIAQYVHTTRDPMLYVDEVSDRSGDFGGSALFAYKLNWQSVMFIGYGDDRELSDTHRLEQLDRQFFIKLSYAFQR
jgi:uncharacterized protein DUF5916/cellulose/xylan binding protein with CBM9 domain